jgi:hypothetical protein
MIFIFLLSATITGLPNNQERLYISLELFKGDELFYTVRCYMAKEKKKSGWARV